MSFLIFCLVSLGIWRLIYLGRFLGWSSPRPRRRLQLDRHQKTARILFSPERTETLQWPPPSPWSNPSQWPISIDSSDDEHTKKEDSKEEEEDTQEKDSGQKRTKSKRRRRPNRRRKAQRVRATKQKMKREGVHWIQRLVEEEDDG